MSFVRHLGGSVGPLHGADGAFQAGRELGGLPRGDSEGRPCRGAGPRALDLTARLGRQVVKGVAVRSGKDRSNRARRAGADGERPGPPSARRRRARPAGATVAEVLVEEPDEPELHAAAVTATAARRAKSAKRLSSDLFVDLGMSSPSLAGPVTEVATAREWHMFTPDDHRCPLQAALFDLDGLLVDSEPLWHEAEILVLRTHGVPLTVEMCRETKGRYVSEAVRHWHDRYPWESPGIDEVVAHVLDVLEELIATRLELKPGVLHAIGECRDRGLRLAVASSAPLRIILSVLARFGLQDDFDSVSSAEHEAAGKPDPAVFLTAALLCRCRAGEMRGVRGLARRDSRGEDGGDALCRGSRHVCRPFIVPGLLPWSSGLLFGSSGLVGSSGLLVASSGVRERRRGARVSRGPRREGVGTSRTRRR